jgi:hypothetical protein
MNAVFITRHGPPEVLQYREAPDPEAKAGEVRIAVRAAGTRVWGRCWKWRAKLASIPAR